MILTVILAALCFGLMVYVAQLLTELDRTNRQVAELDREVQALHRTRHYGGRK